MNNVLELKGKRFVQASKTGKGGGASMNSKKIVTREQLLRLVERISQIKEFWKHEKRPFEGILISVHYNKIVAKSNILIMLLWELNLTKKKRNILLHTFLIWKIWMKV